MEKTFLNRSKENLKAASLLFDNNLYNASANRAYYSAFHCAIVFLLNKGYSPVIDHKNVLSLFINEFINRKKRFPSLFKKYFYELQTTRNEAYYKNGINKNKAKKQLNIAFEFFNVIISELEQ